MSEDSNDDDIKAISTVLAALKPLTVDQRVQVLEFVVRRLGIALGASASLPMSIGPVHSQSLAAPALITSPAAGLTHPTPSAAQDIRSFAADRKPRTVNEKVAVIGYYLANLAPADERRDYLVSEDIKTYFVQAGFELPTAPPGMTLSHAKNAGYLNAMDRGQYRLNAVGHNLVAHKLPGNAGGETRSRPQRKAAKKKKRA